MGNNKNTKLLLTGAVVILVIIAIFWMKNKNSAHLGVSSGEEKTEDTSFGSVNADGKGMSYASALSKYSSAHITFDETCKADPSNLGLKGMHELMVENNSSMDRVISVGTPFNIKANSFKVVEVTGTNIQLDCDQSKNVATVVVE